MTKEAIEANPGGILAGVAQSEGGTVSGHTVFDAADKGDDDAKRVIDEYISYLAVGLGNLINGLNPEVVSIGGGIGKQGERLLVPLRERIIPEIYEGLRNNFSKIVSCTLGYKAGLIGAAMAAK